MKLKVYIKELTPGCMSQIIGKGDWIDLRCAKKMVIPASTIETVPDNRRQSINLETYYVPLGIAAKLPKGFEAIIAPRSSTAKKFGLFIPTGKGVIDNSYQDNEDEWNFVCSPMRRSILKQGDRICQFRIQLSQKATFFDKLRWLFSSGIELIKVNDLHSTNRGGLGSTGIN